MEIGALAITEIKPLPLLPAYQQLKNFFAQLYANPATDADPFSGGRQMNCHFCNEICQ